MTLTEVTVDRQFNLALSGRELEIIRRCVDMARMTGPTGCVAPGYCSAGLTKDADNLAKTGQLRPV